MFINGPSPIALLHAAAFVSHLQYASLVTEIADDSTVLCGAELKLPQLELLAHAMNIFSWEPTHLDPTTAYKKACLKTVSFLQLRQGAHEPLACALAEQDKARMNRKVLLLSITALMEVARVCAYQGVGC